VEVNERASAAKFDALPHVDERRLALVAGARRSEHGSEPARRRQGAREMTESTLLPDLLRERAASEPDRIAMIVDGRGSMSYGDWETRSNVIARNLIQRGVAVGDRVATFFENAEWLDFAAAYFGVLKAGATAVPLSSRFTGRELTSIVDRCAAVGVIWGAQKPQAPGWMATVTELERGESGETFQIPVGPDSVAEVLYTSGTTGLSKGVACRHVHAVRPLMDVSWPPTWWRACAAGVSVHANAISTAAGQLRLVEPLGPLRMTTLALPVFDPGRLCNLLAENAAAVVQLVPSMAISILDTGAEREHDLAAVRVVSMGCAPLPTPLIPRLSAAFANARLVNLYELTEARHAGTALLYDGAHAGSVGTPRGATQVRVTDEVGTEVPPGVVGEIRLRWPGVPPQHYFRDAAATASVFVDGWTRTGDAGYLDETGYLHLVDRLKDVIIKGGLTIGSLEVENVLCEHTAVADCAVFGFPDRVHGENVAAAVVLHRPVAIRDLRDFLHSRLAPHKIPTRFLELDELPRNRAGKVVKSQLRERIPA
jgi:acyl-CoA synthetase (AMP-forming)/AMP-acid ligase II